MNVISQPQINCTYHTTPSDLMMTLFSKLDEAIDDMEHGNVQTLEEAWLEIDTI